MAARRAHVSAEIAKRRKRRNAIIWVVVLIVLISAPIIYFQASGGFAKGMTKLSTVFTFINKHEAADESFAYNPPWDWKQAENLADLYQGFGIPSNIYEQSIAAEYAGAEVLAFTPPSELLAGGIIVSSKSSAGKSIDSLKTETQTATAMLPVMIPGAVAEIKDTTHMHLPAFEFYMELPTPSFHIKTRSIAMIANERIHSIALVGDRTSYDLFSEDFEITLKAWRPKLSGLEGVEGSGP